MYFFYEFQVISVCKNHEIYLKVYKNNFAAQPKEHLELITDISFDTYTKLKRSFFSLMRTKIFTQLWDAKCINLTELLFKNIWI